MKLHHHTIRIETHASSDAKLKFMMKTIVSVDYVIV